MEHELVIATPHLGASTAEAQVKVAQEIAQAFLDAKEGKPLQGVVIGERSERNLVILCARFFSIYNILYLSQAMPCRNF